MGRSRDAFLGFMNIVLRCIFFYAYQEYASRITFLAIQNKNQLCQLSIIKYLLLPSYCACYLHDKLLLFSNQSFNNDFCTNIFNYLEPRSFSISLTSNNYDIIISFILNSMLNLISVS